MRFSLKRSLGNALTKLNVEGSNPYARFGGDGCRACLVNLVNHRANAHPGIQRPCDLCLFGSNLAMRYH